MSSHGASPGHEAEAPRTVLGKAAGWIEKGVAPVYRWLGYAAALVLALVVIAMVYSAIGRWIGHPLNGASDIIEMGFLLMIAGALGIEHMGHEKMTVDAIAKLFPKKFQDWLQPIIYILVVVILVIAIWQLFKHGVRLQDRGETTAGVLRLPKAPFIYVIAAGVLTLLPIYLARLLRSVDRLVKR